MSKKKSSKEDSLVLERCNPIYKVVKTSLKSILKDPEDFQLKLNELVIKCNDIITQTYQFIRLYCLFKFKNEEEIPKLDSKFIKYCIRTLGIRDNKGRRSENKELEEELKDFYEGEFQPLINHQKFNLLNLSQILTYLADQMETCIKNNLKEHFIKRLLRFINIIGGYYLDNRITIDGNPIKIDRDKKKKILRLTKNAILNNKYEEIPTIMKNWFIKHKENILPEEFKESISYDIKVYPFKYIKYSFYMNKVLENKGFKLFQPLSLRNSCIPSYITIDTTALILLFWGKGKSDLINQVKDNKDLIWDKFFNMEHKIFKNTQYNFNFTIQTDGIGCSILFLHKSIENKKFKGKVEEKENSFYYISELNSHQLEDLKTKNIVGCDPGKHNLIYMTDGNGKKLRYTNRQRYTETLSIKNNRIILNNKIRDKIIEKETKLSDQNSKTVNYEKFKKYLVKKTILNLEVREFYLNELYRKLKWRHYTYTQRSESRLLNNIEKTFGKNPVICYGDYERSTQMKYLMPSMGIGLRKVISKKFLTLSINEYNTSKKCCNCFNDLSYKYINGKRKFRLLTCQTCGNIGSSKSETNPIYLTRDMNSAINIMNLGKCYIENKSRPEEFSRTSKGIL